MLSVARGQLAGDSEFQRFMDQFCRQMSSAASPGHHIILTDADGRPSLRAHQRPNAALETQMATAARNGFGRFTHNGADYIAVGVTDADGRTVAVAQSLERIEGIIRTQGVNRAVSAGVMILLVFVVTSAGLLVWVRRPLRHLVRIVHAVADGRFDVRARNRGSAELRVLSGGLNAMTRSLEHAARVRESEMKRAQVIQEGLLPSRHERVPGYSLDAVFIPAERVGGDLFDIVPLSDGAALIAVLDISGHGVPAALYTALLRTILRYEAEANAEPAAILHRMNREFLTTARNSDFATCFLVKLAPANGRIECVGAGHDPALIVRAGGHVESLETSGLPLGVEATAVYRAGAASLAVGDRLYLYTDGLHEVSSPHGDSLGRDGLKRLLIETVHETPSAQVASVLERVRRFQESPQFADDVTLLCVNRT